MSAGGQRHHGRNEESPAAETLLRPQGKMIGCRIPLNDVCP
jgi:hypothetical protein